MKIASIESILHEGVYFIRMNKDNWWLESDKDGYEKLEDDHAIKMEKEYLTNCIKPKVIRKYIYMTDSNFKPIIEFGTRFLVADVALPKEDVKDIIKNHSKLPHSTGYYLVTDLSGYREEVRV